MSTRETELRVDRIESGIAVALDGDGKEYCFCEKLATVKENDIIKASINDKDEVVCAEVLAEKTDEIKNKVKNRLNNLFNR